MPGPRPVPEGKDRLSIEVPVSLKARLAELSDLLPDDGKTTSGRRLSRYVRDVLESHVRNEERSLADILTEEDEAILRAFRALDSRDPATTDAILRLAIMAADSEEIARLVRDLVEASRAVVRWNDARESSGRAEIETLLGIEVSR